MIGIVVAIAVAVVVAIIVFTRKKKNPIIKQYTGWEYLARYSPGMPPRPTRLPGGFEVIFPQYPGRVGYVWRIHRKPMKGYITVKGRMKPNDFAEFKPKDHPAGTDCYARVIIQKAGDNWNEANGRFWSNPARVSLKHDGEFELYVPLDSQEWTNVYGQRNKDGLEKAMKNPQRVGLTFGGGNHFGHGVSLTKGYAGLVVTTFKVGS